MWMPEGEGWIEVVCGSMFSGKTEELIRRINRARIAKQPIQTFKPAIDNRYHETEIVSADLMLLSEQDFRRFFALPRGL